jgi:hypothetical protein
LEEKENFSCYEQQNVKDFIKQQNKQDERMMRDFTNKLKKFRQVKAVSKDEFKEALLNRIDKSNEDLDKTKKLL